MEFKKILSASYSWLELKKVNLFLLFFCLAFSIVVLVPFVFEQFFEYNAFTKPIIFGTYTIIYFSLFVGLITLINNSLNKKEENIFDSIKNSFKTLNLVFLELFYVFFWNINPSKRLSQLLLVLLTGLLFILSSIFFNFFWFFSLIIVASILALLIVYNFGRTFFASSVFYEKNFSPKESVLFAWDLTKQNWVSVFAAIIWAFLINFLVFCFVTLGAGTFLSIFFKLFFINNIAIDLGFKVGAAIALAVSIISYHLAVSEIYSQITQNQKGVNQKTTKSIKKKLVTRKRVAKKKTIATKKKPLTKKKVVKKKASLTKSASRKK